MASPEEIPNIEPFPLSPRFRNAGASSELPVAPTSQAAQAVRSFTPVTRSKVEFWHQGEQPSQTEKNTKVRRYDHARRADQMGLLMGVFAVLIIVLVAVALYLNNKKYSFQTGSAPKSTTPVVDFYQGNHAFEKKVKEEKEGPSAADLPVQGANEDFEISLQSQMASMKEKLEKMRSQKLIEEPPIPLPDKGSRPVPVIGVRPTEVQKFNSPMEFNGLLPKPLQETK
jgi:hypothetical protein